MGLEIGDDIDYEIVASEVLMGWKIELMVFRNGTLN
jgi:hypothetical protein